MESCVHPRTAPVHFKAFREGRILKVQSQIVTIWTHERLYQSQQPVSTVFFLVLSLLVVQGNYVFWRCDVCGRQRGISHQGARWWKTMVQFYRKPAIGVCTSLLSLCLIRKVTLAFVRRFWQTAMVQGLDFILVSRAQSVGSHFRNIYCSKCITGFESCTTVISSVRKSVNFAMVVVLVWWHLTLVPAGS